jgi:biotin carboxyl carrier protein
MKIRMDDPDTLKFRFENKKLSVSVIDESDESMTLRINLAYFTFYISESKPGVLNLSSRGFAWQFRRLDVLSNHDFFRNTSKSSENGSISSPMPGKVIKIRVKPGDLVKKGDTLAILEAMKMENHIGASADGVVKEVFVKEGDMVDGGMVLMNVE